MVSQKRKHAKPPSSTRRATLSRHGTVLTLEYVAGTRPLSQLVALELGKVPLLELEVFLVKKDVRLGHHLVALDVALALLVADLGQQLRADDTAVVL